MTLLGLSDSARFDPRETERLLRRQMSGVRLVSEVDLWGEPFEAAKAVIEYTVQSRSQTSAGRHFPASTVIYLVGEGVRNYDGGFWDRLSVPGAEPQVLRPAWREAIDVLGLDDFLWAFEETARPYVTPILFHGGIPAHCARDVFDLIIRELRRGAFDAIDLIAGWRSQPTRFDRLDKPARRFLMRGGDAAVDLLDRLIELVVSDSEGRDNDPHEIGVPAYLVKAFQDMADRDRAVDHRRERVPRPLVVLDPWSGVGPTLVLPALADRALGRRWTVLGGGVIRSFDVSLRVSTSIELDAHGPWEVDLGDADRDGRSFQFQGLTGLPALAFDTGNGRLLRDQHRITRDEIYLVLHRGLLARTPEGTALGQSDEFPELSGAWSHFRTLRIPTAGVNMIELVARDQQSKIRPGRITVHGGFDRPSLEGTPVPGVTGADGRPVYAVLPELRLPVSEGARVNLTVNGLRAERSADPLAQHRGVYSLEGLVPSGSLASVDLSVRGHLGGDLRDTGFVVVPGLVVEGPPSPLGPSETASLSVSTDPGMTVGNSGRAVATIEVDPGTESVAVCVQDATKQLDLRVAVPRVQWTATGSRGTGVLGGTAVTLSPDDLADGIRLLVRAGQASELRLDLVGGDGVLQQVGPVKSGPDGRWSFDLMTFADTVRAADRPELHLQLNVDGQAHPIGSVVTRYVISELSLESLVDADAGETLLVVHFQENRPFSRRELRLWSTSRPWSAPVRFAISDDCRGDIELLAGPEVLPGVYLAEVAVADDWIPATRPVGDHDARRVSVGSDADHAAHLQSLDSDEGRGALELIMEKSPRVGPLSDEAVVAVGGELITAFTSVLDPPTKRTFTEHRFRQLKELLFQVPDLLARAVPDFLADSRRDETDAAQLSIALACDAFDCPLENATDAERRRLYRSAPILAAAADSWISNTNAADRWADHFGWDPRGAPPESGEGIDSLVVLMNRSAADLQAIREILEIDEIRLLTATGLQAAMFSWLVSSYLDGFRLTREWQGAYGRLNDTRLRRDDRFTGYLDALTPSGKAPGAARFPADLQAAAFHMIRFGGERDAATLALWKAHPIAPALVERSILLAIAINRS